MERKTIICLSDTSSQISNFERKRKNWCPHSTDPKKESLKREGSVEWKRKSCVTAGKTWLIIVSFFLMCQVLPSDFLFFFLAATSFFSRARERRRKGGEDCQTNRDEFDSEAIFSLTIFYNLGTQVILKKKMKRDTDKRMTYQDCIPRPLTSSRIPVQWLETWELVFSSTALD